MNDKNLNKLILQALREDAADKDITSDFLIPAAHTSSGAIIVKEDSVICGLTIAKKVFQKIDRNIRFQTKFKDGSKVERNTKIATLRGKTRSLLAGERTALNFLGYLSGIATNTHHYVKKIRRQKAKIYDTRKTTPGLRALEKYAVKCGGGYNHRHDLSELVLIKDNHRDACHPNLSIPQAVNAIRRRTKKTLEIEVDNLSQLKQALTAGPDLILLDNMTRAQIKKAVKLTRSMPRNKRPLLEASGGITLANVVNVAKMGVDRISIGSLTRSHKAIDVSLELTIQ